MGTPIQCSGRCTAAVEGRLLCRTLLQGSQLEELGTSRTGCTGVRHLCSEGPEGHRQDGRGMVG